MANEIFISYRRTDEPRARLFYNLLRERGVEAWYDAKIEAGEDWRTTTANALDAAPIFVLLMSKTASESGDIAKELAAATHKRKLVVPVRLDDMQLEGMFLYELASRNWIDAYKDTENRLADLADRLAALVKAGLSPEAAAALDMNAAESAAAKGSKGGAKKAKATAGAKRKSGAVALITAAAVAVVGAAGAGVWFMRGQPNADAASPDVAVAAKGVDEQTTRSLGLAAPVVELVTAAKAAGRSEAEIAALTEAGDKLTAMSGKATAGGDPAALSQLASEMNDVALTAARNQIEALAADPIVAIVRNDFKAAEAEHKSSGVKVDPALAKAIEESNTAQAALKAARETAAGADGAAAVAAVSSAQQAIDSLIKLRPAATDAFIKAKRLSFASNSAAARTAAGQIAQLAGAKKPGVFASNERKEAHKFLLATDAWARERMAAVDSVTSAVGSADRKALAKYASQAATARAEIEAALATARTEAAKLGS